MTSDNESAIRPGIRRIIYACFLVSGAAGLIYEVVWARQLSLFLGITTYAHTAVISAYMIGLALGGLLLGRLADRATDCLRFYAWLEIGVGLYAAVTPWLLPAIQSIYASSAGSIGITGTASHLLRFFLAMLALLVPTCLMGGTLPLLVRGLSRNLPQMRDRMGRLYGINTLGAAIGTISAGYLLLPALGLRMSIYMAVLLNLGVGTVVLSLRRRVAKSGGPRIQVRRAAAAQKPQAGRAHPDDTTPPERRALLLLGFAVSGFAALVYEIAWIRALTLVIGSSVYAFSTTLATYLSGLGLGSILYSRFLSGHRSRSDPGRRFEGAAGLEVGIAASAVLGLPLIGRLPDLFLSGYRAGLHESFPLFQLFIFGLCFLVMFLPTLLLGALFPLLSTLCTHDGKTIGRGVGNAYAANTGGTVLGAMLGGLLLLPNLGVQNSLVLAATLHIMVGMLFWWLRLPSQRFTFRLATSSAIILLFCIAVSWLPPWNRAVMTSGTFVNAEKLIGGGSGDGLQEQVRERELLYYAEGIDGVVSVEQNESERFLVINGKDDASSRSDLPTQVLLGQLPMLIHPDPNRVLVIGLGSGITVGSVATHDSAERIDVLEISPEVVEASRFFAAEHGNVLSDPRVQLIVADARNFVLADRTSYDVITSEPSNPWISGISNLFTLDFFKLARTRLAPGGVMAQWLETYNMSDDDVKTVLRTFQTVFPHVSVWMPMLGDLILIGTTDSHWIDYSRLELAVRQAAVEADLRRIDLANPAPLLSTFLIGGQRLAGYVAGASINTDARPRIEFNAPRYLYANLSLTNLIDIVRYGEGVLQEVPVTGLVTRFVDRLSAPGLGVTVRIDASHGVEDLRADWRIGRQIPATGANGDPEMSMTSRRVLLWREGNAVTRIEAAHVGHAPRRTEREQYLGAVLSKDPAVGGEVTLPGGSTGSWTATTDVTSGQVELALTWAVGPGPDLFTRYLLVRTDRDVGGIDQEEVVRYLAGRIEPLE